MRFAATVEITGLEGIADPEGMTIERALPALGFGGVEGVHVGKVVRFVLEAADEAAAKAEVSEMCSRLLANPVIQRSSIRLTPAPDGGGSGGSAGTRESGRR
jgi:phosphoribosylformylglycinamidine synthase PurS subunit